MHTPQKKKREEDIEPVETIGTPPRTPSKTAPQILKSLGLSPKKLEGFLQGELVGGEYSWLASVKKQYKIVTLSENGVRLLDQFTKEEEIHWPIQHLFDVRTLMDKKTVIFDYKNERVLKVKSPECLEIQEAFNEIVRQMLEKRGKDAEKVMQDSGLSNAVYTIQKRGGRRVYAPMNPVGPSTSPESPEKDILVGRSSPKSRSLKRSSSKKEKKDGRIGVTEAIDSPSKLKRRSMSPKTTQNEVTASPTKLKRRSMSPKTTQNDVLNDFVGLDETPRENLGPVEVVTFKSSKTAHLSPINFNVGVKKEEKVEKRPAHQRQKSVVEKSVESEEFPMVSYEEQSY